jgi:Spy/CpxP family protein refolding chaperone
MRYFQAILAALVASLGLASAAEPAAVPTEISRTDFLQNAAVQKELKLTPDQLAKLRKAFVQHRDDMQDIWQQYPPNEASTKWQELNRELKKDVLAILNDEQRYRFWQIDFQSMVGMAFDSGTYLRPEIDKRLDLTDPQRQKLREIQTETNKKNAQIFQPGKQINYQVETGKIRKADKEQVAAVLTDEQKKRWQELIGAPFVVTSFDSFADLRNALGKWIRDDFGKAQAEAKKTGKPIFALFRCEP